MVGKFLDPRLWPGGDGGAARRWPHKADGTEYSGARVIGRRYTLYAPRCADGKTTDHKAWPFRVKHKYILEF